MFKVVPDQLRISEGWVRCGHCTEVFDASAHLQVDQSPIFLPLDVALPEEPVSPVVLAPEPVPEPAPSMAFMPSLPASAAAAPDRPQHSRPLRDDDDAGDSVSGADDPAEDVSFVQQARRRAFWRRPLVRVGLGLFALALGALLALQVGVQERDRLAAMEPALRPWLEQVCIPLGCRVGPPRQIEAVVIDSSSFNKLRSDLYRLSFTLKNQSITEIAMPAIELTLTDTQDQPVLRRVLRPPEMGSAAGVIGAASEWSAALSVAVAGGGANRIAGYRLLAFYP